MPFPPRVTRRLALAAFACVTMPALGGCGDDPDTPLTREAVVGRWTLRRIDGVALPVTVSAAAERTDLVAGTLELREGGGCSDVQTLRVTPPPGATFGAVIESLLDTPCRWGLADGRLVLTYPLSPSQGAPASTERLATLGAGRVLTVHAAAGTGALRRWDYER